MESGDEDDAFTMGEREWQKMNRDLSKVWAVVVILMRMIIYDKNLEFYWLCLNCSKDIEMERMKAGRRECKSHLIKL